MPSAWGRTFRRANGEPIVGKGNAYFELRHTSGSPTYYLTESDTMKGYYYHALIPYGTYDIYINGVKDTDLSGTSGIVIV